MVMNLPKTARFHFPSRLWALRNLLMHLCVMKRIALDEKRWAMHFNIRVQQGLRLKSPMIALCSVSEFVMTA